MKVPFNKRLVFSSLLSIILSASAFASHIIGGDLTIKYLGPNNYEVKATLFRDCSGAGAAFPGTGAEAPMYIGVYDKVTHTQQQIITMGTPIITVVGMGDACFLPNTCVEKGIYITSITLPNNTNGYYLSWLRCCRNAIVTNIVTPSSEGSVFYAEIPNPAIANSSPVFNTIPQGTQGYMCSNFFNTVDFAATDADGDILIYSLASPLSCNPTCSSGFPNPNTTGTENLPGPYGTITWNAGYSATQPFGASTTTLSATSGLLSVVPTQLGVYALTVKIEEYRASVKIGEIYRDFQFEVLTCQRLNINIQPAATICTGQTATLSASGALAGWTYSWNPSGQTGTAITVLASANGTYNYTATATNGANCITNNSTLAVSGPIANISTSGNPCLGQNISLTASGGTSYNWNNGETTAVLTGVSNGSYTVTVGNGSGCTSTATGVISQPSSLTSTLSVNNITCSGNPASATVNATGGTGGYTYAWTGGQTTQTATALGSGNYTVTITDSQGCTSANTFSIDITSAPTLSVSTTPGNCTSPSGTATANASGGAPTYSYAWDDGQTTQTATGLASGNYSITVADMNGCTTSSTVTVTNPTGFSVSLDSIFNSNCHGDDNGKIFITPAGGQLPYTFAWSNSATTDDITGLAPGTYSVLVADVNNCSFSLSASVNEPAILTASASMTQESCVGNNNGSVDLTASGGTPPYSYAWNPTSQTTEDISGLSSGTYSINITDKNGCVTINSYSINPAIPLALVSDSIKNIDCAGNSNGAIYISVNGGIPPYTYSWNPGAQTSQDISGLSTGSYTVNVTDSKGCVEISSYAVSPATPLTLVVDSTKNNLCNGGSSGEIYISFGGGVSPYTYSWSPSGQTSQDISGLASGTHSLTATDNNGCSTVCSATITAPTALTASVSTAIPAGCGSANGSITIDVNGGTPAYSYAWLPSGGSSSTATTLANGNYSLTITDANSCIANLYTSVDDSCNYVWPGDANDDGVATNMDIISIGLGYGSTGPVRSGATLNWIGQPCSDWADTLTGNINYKNIDCNGDGVIDDSDTLAIVQNYGMVHNNKMISPIVNSGTDFYTVMSTDSVGSGGAVITVQIGLGTAIAPAANIYAVAYSISFNDPSLVDMSSLSFSGVNSWLGTIGTDLMALGFPNGDAALTRTNQTNASGNGIIQTLKFNTSNALNGSGNSATLNVNITNATVISVNETVIPVNILSDSLVMKDTLMATAVNNVAGSKEILLYPNPTSGLITVSHPANTNEITIGDVLGRKVFQAQVHPGSKISHIDLSWAPAGVYFLEIKSLMGSMVKKIIRN